MISLKYLSSTGLQYSGGIALLPFGYKDASERRSLVAHRWCYTAGYVLPAVLRRVPPRVHGLDRLRRRFGRRSSAGENRFVRIESRRVARRRRRSLLSVLAR